MGVVQTLHTKKQTVRVSGKKELHFYSGIRIENDSFDIKIGEDCVLMQYTGLKDKNGAKIFEGDICKYDENDSMSMWVSGETFVVVGLNGRFTARMNPYDKHDGSNQNTMNEDVEDCVTIIGNIHENKELLQ